MPILGAHMSIAGGHYRAVQRAVQCGCDCVQIFTKSNAQWRAKSINDSESQRFRETLAAAKMQHAISHSSYLINLATPDRALRKRSIDALIVELQRAEQLGIRFVVLHPGAYTTSSEARGLKAVAQSLDRVHAQTSGLEARCLLENTAGQGSCLGWRFEHLAAIMEASKDPERLGVCFDTCHAFAAGYPLKSKRDYQQTMRHLDRCVGTGTVQAIHLNDSKRDLGSRLDRHEHIGKGKLGLEPFRWLLNDRRFKQTPMFLETPKGRDGRGTDWDVANLRILRGLVQ